MLVKRTLVAAMEADFSDRLGYERNAASGVVRGNSRNGLHQSDCQLGDRHSDSRPVRSPWAAASFPGMCLELPDR